MSTDPIKYTKPIYYNPPVVHPNYETTVRAPGAGNPYLSNPYESNLPPPPPPAWPMQQKRRSFLVPFLLLFIGILCVLLIGTLGIFIQVIPHTTTLTGKTQASPLEVATPTVDAQQALDYPDFSTFIRGFAQALSEKRYNLIQKHTDTNNFQSIALYADANDTDWQFTYDRMTAGKRSFTIPLPIITPNQEGYSCVGYTQQGVSGLMNIQAQAIRYVVGTMNDPSDPDTLQTTRNATVFIFEETVPTANQPSPPVSPSWFWRGYTLNNLASMCQAPQ